MMCKLPDLKMRIFLVSFLLFVVVHGEETVNKKVVRTVDIASQLVKVVSTVSVKVANADYVVVINRGYEDQLSFIGASSKEGDDEKDFVVTESDDSSLSNRKFNVHFGNKYVGRTLTFNLKTIYGHKLTAFPAEIKQSEKQFMKFIGNLYFYSPYFTEQQETQVITTTANVLSYTQDVKPVSKQDNKINYGIYRDKPAFSKQEFIVHYENNSPFLVVTSLNRLIEVSHWGNIAVEETVDIYHHGAKLKGSFSRYDYQRNQDGISSVKSFTTVFHAAAKDVYYRDEIGNVSTSHLKELSDSVEVELRPRFPLFGGWKTHYTIGYNVPSYEFLFSKDSRFALKIRFIDHIFDDQLVDHATIKVVLPERVSDITVKTPFDVIEGQREILKTYLDTSGRTVVVLSKANLVEQHIQDFEVHYTFNMMMVIREPLMVIVAFYLLFLFVIICVRLDFSITKDEASESKMRVAGMVEELQGVHDKRCAVYQSYDDAINKFKSSKDNERFTKDRKKIDADHKALCQQVITLQLKLKGESIESVEKVKELQSSDSALKEYIAQSIQLAEKVVSGKVQKNDYVEAENKLMQKRKEVMQKMETLVSSL